MNEGIGNTIVMFIIIVFIAFVSAYMAYNVNYTKAFRMKNKIIAYYEEYNGQCGRECSEGLASYASDIGYNPYHTLDCSNPGFSGYDSFRQVNELYCEYTFRVRRTNGAFDDSKEQYYYRILTRIDIQIPIVQNTLTLRALNVTGDTKVFEKES